MIGARTTVSVAGVALSVSLGGCLGPQDDDLLPPVVQLNRAPWIVTDKAVASGAFEDYVDRQAECPLWFEAVVEDPDVDDRVEYRWYVTRIEPLEEPRIFADGYLRNTGQPRRTPERIDFDSKQPNNPLAAPGLYQVQFMAFDGALTASQGPGSVPESEPIPGTDGARNPRFSDYYTWTVRLIAGECTEEDVTP